MTKSIFLPFVLLMLIGVVSCMYRDACLYPRHKFNNGANGVSISNGLIHTQFAKFDGTDGRIGGSCYWLWVRLPNNQRFGNWDEADTFCRDQANLPNGFKGGQLAEIDDIKVKIHLNSLLEKKRKSWWVGPQKSEQSRCPRYFPGRKKSEFGQCNRSKDTTELFFCQSFASAQDRCYEYEGWQGGRDQQKLSNNTGCAACITLKKNGEKEAFYKKCATDIEKCGHPTYIPVSGKWSDYDQGQSKFKVGCCVGDLCNDATPRKIQSLHEKKSYVLH